MCTTYTFVSGRIGLNIRIRKRTSGVICSKSLLREMRGHLASFFLKS